MYYKLIIHAIILLLCFWFQRSFLEVLPGWFSDTNFILVILAYVLLVTDMKKALWWAIGFGIISDVFYFLPFGHYLAIFIIILCLMDFLLSNLLTDRSLYSIVALVLVSTLAFEAVNFTAMRFYALFSPSESAAAVSLTYLSSLLSGLVMNGAATAGIFYIFNQATQSFKPVFINKKRR